MSTLLSPEQWQHYERDGYLKLGKVLSDDALATLQQRINDIMLGKADIDYGRFLMQLDSPDGQYNNAGAQSKGFKGATLAYRKIQDLEHDPEFMVYMQRPLFREICACIYGQGTPVAAFRAMFMNKPAHQGTLLPWHQDRWSYLDRDPLITIWTALDPATVANGCVEVIPGSHKRGLLNSKHVSGFLTEEQAVEASSSEESMYLELQAGEVVLLHNWLLHRSDTNSTDIARRAFSVCYMDARTKSSQDENYTLIFEDDKSENYA
ncbi:phytanoyl-CoA dioxygenase family protein [Ktedonospora formicarum]|uniref:Phytanoyl-CoA dioxygenase n=1 Tax=Ktedonospora formicarum TaxID=2778364 RepID=A0A8J3I013_9CHLR|nr:phytanoyl-CoA dioxygenase family protein [Ktedonospora formicarum]GHO46311.1 hypothetical protein KSX_44740 [Ktedonospora formicarum]